MTDLILMSFVPAVKPDALIQAQRLSSAEDAKAPVELQQPEPRAKRQLSKLAPVESRGKIVT